MLERIDALVRSQQRFIAHAAHELRSPLTSLLGELSHALRRPRDADGYRTAIEEALAATRHLKLLTEDLLMLVRLDAGLEHALPKEPLSTAALLRSAVRTVEAEAGERGVKVLAMEEDLLVEGNPLDLIRMLRNLLENAVRHSPPSGQVEATCRTREGCAEIVVRDEGPGVDPDDRERIFAPFYRGPREHADGLPGAGLGLAIAREIARAHGGERWLAEPQPSPGAAFIVRLPLSPMLSLKRDFHFLSSAKLAG